MKTALIIGGTGLIGKQLTHLLLGDKRYSKVTLLVRQPMNLIHQKMEQVQFDFDHPDEKQIVADDIYCCLGTTKSNAGSKAAFYKIDFEYVTRIAAIAHKNGVKRFALVSSMGADKNSFFYYNKVKGLVEEAISDTGFEGCFIFRPSLLLGHRSEFRFGESFAKLMFRVFSFLVPKKYKPIEGSKVAKAMVDITNSDLKGLHIFESDIIAEMHP